MSAPHVAYQGEYVDHLYANCPNLRRRPVRQCVDKVDPEGTDICKRCVNVWRRAGRPCKECRHTPEGTEG